MTNVTQTVTAPKTELDFLYEFVDWLDREGKVTPNDIAAFDAYLYCKKEAEQIVAADFEGMF